MNKLSKKKMMELISHLKEGVNSFKLENDPVLSPVSVENVGLFIYLMGMMGDHLRTLEADCDLCLTTMEGFCAKGQNLVTGTPNPQERGVICKELACLLETLQLQVGKQVPEDKKELVFFPYLYAMWDSLESVWRAAVDSGEYDVSVVPIPYYSKNRDGSFGEMHYDGALYPEEVQIIPWESYHVEERKPYVAYVHNPYDGINLVTSIHPNFYVEKLKPHVGSLVYIPYFIGINNQVPTHFCNTPVTIHADKIIVQSPEVKGMYVEAMYQFLKPHHPTLKKSHIGNKILALGSPKLDGKGRSKEVLMEGMPAEWIPLLRKKDGTLKKVMFFNLSLGSLLAFSNALEKWRHSLGIFRAYSEDIALWWRPHPLLESTLVSMRPGMLQEYEQMVRSYQQEGWGIYDDCMEFHTAVECCDAYYGDSSSVVEVFLGAKKPVMVQQYHVMKRILEQERG